MRKTKSVWRDIALHFFSHFASLFWLFAFHSILRQGRYSCEMSKDFVGFFFMALIKYEIHLKCEKCIVSVSHFMVRFPKYLRNAKYEKCIAGLRGLYQDLHNNYEDALAKNTELVKLMSELCAENERLCEKQQ